MILHNPVYNARSLLLNVKNLVYMYNLGSTATNLSSYGVATALTGLAHYDPKDASSTTQARDHCLATILDPSACSRSDGTEVVNAYTGSHQPGEAICGGLFPNLDLSGCVAQHSLWPGVSMKLRLPT